MPVLLHLSLPLSSNSNQASPICFCGIITRTICTTNLKVSIQVSINVSCWMRGLGANQTIEALQNTVSLNMLRFSSYVKHRARGLILIVRYIQWWDSCVSRYHSQNWTVYWQSTRQSGSPRLIFGFGIRGSQGFGRHQNYHGDALRTFIEEFMQESLYVRLVLLAVEKGWFITIIWIWPNFNHCLI